MDAIIAVFISLSGLIISLQGITLQKLFNLERRLSRIEGWLNAQKDVDKGDSSSGPSV